jgi:uncharacterized membrane protein YqjE
MSDKIEKSAGDDSGGNAETLPALISRLGDRVVTLFDTKFQLLKIEMKEEVNAYLRNSLFIAVGGIILAVGFALFTIALAFFLTALLENAPFSQPLKYAFGFILAGVVYLGIGALVVMKAKNRLARQSLVPEESLQELEKDKQWLQGK